VTPPTPAANRRVPIRLAAASGALLVAGFALVVLIHRLLSDADGASLALLIAIGWVAACAVASSLGSRRRTAGLTLTAAGLAAAWAAWPWLLARVEWVYLVQHAGSHLLLGLWFGGSLIAARRGLGAPLITRLATRLHGPLPPPIRRYTAQVTVGWTIYFFLMSGASCAVYAFGSIEAWSTLANLLTLPIVIALFVIEYLLRLRLHPEFEHVSILEGVRAFMR